MLFAYLPQCNDDISFHTQSVDCGGFGKRTGPQLLWVILQNLKCKGAANFYDQLMLGCGEKNLGRGLLPVKLFSNKAKKIHE